MKASVKDINRGITKNKSIQNLDKNHRNCSKGINTRPASSSLINNQATRKLTIAEKKHEELFGVIDSFHENLCNLPLERLIATEQPHQWLIQQTKTLASLMNKLNKCTALKDYHYHRMKLQSVELVLTNIKQNVNMLARMAIIGNYQSSATGTDSSSCGSSRQSRVEEIKEKGGHQQGCGPMLFYDQYIIRQNFKKDKSKQLKNQSGTIKDHQSSISKHKNSLQSPALPNAQTVVSQASTPSRSLISMRTKQEEICGNSLIKKNDQTTSTNEICGEKHFQYENNENINNMNTLQHTKKCLDVERIPPHNHHKISDLTAHTKTMRQHQNKFLEDQLLQLKQQQTKHCLDKLSDANTKRRGHSPLIASKAPPATLSTLIQIKHQKETITSSPERHQLEKDYIELTKQLRMELMDKDKEIQNLLINQQAFEDKLDQARGEIENKQFQNVFLKQRTDNLQKIIEQYERNAQRAKQRQEELKDAIKLQRERTKREMQLKDAQETKYDKYIDQNMHFRQQLQQLQSKLASSHKAQKVEAEKAAIYRRKYYQVLNDLEKIKQQITTCTRCGEERTLAGKTELHQLQQLQSTIRAQKDAICRSIL